MMTECTCEKLGGEHQSGCALQLRLKIHSLKGSHAAQKELNLELLGNLEALVLKNLKYEEALLRIREINCGPDQASGQWRADEAADIADKALAPSGKGDTK